jgi:hypothetical protein
VNFKPQKQMFRQGFILLLMRIDNEWQKPSNLMNFNEMQREQVKVVCDGGWFESNIVLLRVG